MLRTPPGGSQSLSGKITHIANMKAKTGVSGHARVRSVIGGTNPPE
jgi:hypothetical protein